MLPTALALYEDGFYWLTGRMDDVINAPLAEFRLRGSFGYGFLAV